MNSIFRCRKCGSEKLDVEHVWKEVETGVVYVACECEQGAGSDGAVAAQVRYRALYEPIEDWHFDSEWHLMNSTEGYIEISYMEPEVHCRECYEASEFPHDFVETEAPNILINNDSHKFKIGCAICHTPIKCVGDIEEFVWASIVEESSVYS